MHFFLPVRLLSLLALLGLVGACTTVPAERSAQDAAGTPAPLGEAPDSRARQAMPSAPAPRPLALTLPVARLLPRPPLSQRRNRSTRT